MKVLTLEEYCQQSAQKMLDSGLCDEVHFGDPAVKSYFNIDRPTDDLGDRELEIVEKARKNREELREIAKGGKVDPIYALYYYNVYLKEKEGEK